jgi:hypothetical protein
MGPRATASSLVVAASLTAICGAAPAARPSGAAEEGPQAERVEIALDARAAAAEDTERLDIVAQARLQTAGQIVLAGAFLCAIVGIVLIEVDPYALAFGEWGFSLVGAGVGALITSSFILGFTRPVHVGDHPLERERRRRHRPPPDSRL